MGRRVFLDIGAHVGETLAEARRAEWGFDLVVCFEPASACWPAVEKLAGPSVLLERFGLWDRDATLTLHDAGQIGASISAGKSRGLGTERVQLRDGAVWFRDNVMDDDEVFVKINVEGAECALIHRLAESGELRKIDHLMVHFDVRKIPGQQHEADVAEKVLDRAGVDWIDARDIMFGRSHALKTRNWLLYAKGGRYSRWVRRHPVRWSFRLRQVAYRLRERIRGG